MNSAAKIRCGVYAVSAVAALVATWSQNLAYDGSAVLSQFLPDTAVTAASRSITADILMLSVPVTVLMVSEARKHNVRFVWAYVFGAFVTAISFTFPLFLIARERRMAAEDASAPGLGALDVALLAVATLLPVAGTLWVVTQ
ncbi:hypothetical protein A5715_13670 [Mycolicibacter heraklionensis]|nr:hypothetical protein A5715_13670 [Mycolicibacter heraklionensis]